MRRGDRVRLDLPGSHLDMEVKDAHEDSLFLTCTCCEGDTTVAFVHKSTVDIRSDAGRFAFREPDFAVRRTHMGFAEALEGGA